MACLRLIFSWNWHFATHEAEWVQSSTDREKISAKNPFKMGFCFYPTFKNQIQPLNPLKNVSRRWFVLDDRHCFSGALSQVRATDLFHNNFSPSG